MAHFNLTAQQIAAVMAMLPDDDDDQLRADMLEGETELHEFASMLIRFNEDDEGIVNALSEQIDARKVRQDRAKARIANRRDMIRALMEMAQLKKLPLPEATITLGEGKARLGIVDPDAVPEEYQVVKKTPDKRAINAAFEDEELPNWLVRLEPETTITIRRK